MVADILNRFATPPDGAADALPELRLSCGALAFDRGGPEGVVYCTGAGVHRQHTWRRGGVWESKGRCPEADAEFVRERLDREAKNLSGLIAETARIRGKGKDQWRPTPTGVVPVLGGGFIDWTAFDQDRHPSAREAFDVVRELVASRPVQGRVLLQGTRGLGKGLLQLLAHFTWLRAGVNSVWVDPPELRRILHAANSYESDAREKAEAKLYRIRSAEAVVLDDLGFVAEDARRVGEMAEGIKDVLSCAKALLASSNLNAVQMLDHPDIGAASLDRIWAGAEVVVLEGVSWREETRHVRRSS